jgi:glycerate-2-kinase
MKAVREHKLAPDPINSSHLVILDNQTAVKAAYLKALELIPIVSMETDIREQSIQEGCDLLLARLMARPKNDATLAVISGGEFSCPVRGNGRGGRNLETALRCAIALDQERGKGPHIVGLSAGTDGIDGNSPAAGAIADETTIQRARKLGLDADEYLERSDSYTFFERLGDLSSRVPQVQTSAIYEFYFALLREMFSRVFPFRGSDIPTLGGTQCE